MVVRVHAPGGEKKLPASPPLEGAMLWLCGYMPPEAEKKIASITPFGGGNAVVVRVHAPGGEKKMPASPPFGWGNAGSFQYKLSTVVQRV